MIGPAIRNLRPTSKFSVGDTYSTLIWMDEDIPPPTGEEVDAEVARLRQEWQNTEYQRLRAPAYPPIGDQLDALWKGGDAAAEMLARVQAVKAQFPKPEGV